MPDLFLLISHELTDGQMAEARETLGCGRIVVLPRDLQELWSSVDPSLESVDEASRVFVQWLEEHSAAGDICHIQGDFGLTYALVTWAWRNGRIPVYAATQRVYNHSPLENGAVRTMHVFRHVRYRRYPRPECP